MYTVVVWGTVLGGVCLVGEKRKRQRTHKKCKNFGLIEELHSGVCQHVGVCAVNTLRRCNEQKMTRERLQLEESKIIDGNQHV